MSLAGADAGFMAEQRARAAERAARFAREAAKPPPPLPMHRKTVSGGAVSKPKSQFDVLSAFIRRKLVANMAIDPVVLEKARAIGIDVGRLAREAEQEPSSPAPAWTRGPTLHTRGAASALDADLDKWWSKSSSQAHSRTIRARSLVSMPSALPVSTSSEPAATEPGLAAIVSAPAALAARQRRHVRSKRWRLPYLMLSRKLTLRTSTCRAFFRHGARRYGKPTYLLSRSNNEQTSTDTRSSE